MRRLSLILLALLVVVAVVTVSVRYRAAGDRTGRRVASADSMADTLAQSDSAIRANARAARDTMCLASRIGLPCNDR